MTDFAALLQPDRGQPAHPVHLIDKNSITDWLKRQPAARRALLKAMNFDGKGAGKFAILPGTGDAYEVVAAVADVEALTPWCLARLGELLDAGSYQLEGRPPDGPVIRSERGGHMSAGSVVNWFRCAYDQLGLSECSSHSGRRTFITMSARVLAKTGGSLRDIQELAGHRSLTTTEKYIVGDRDAQRRLIRLI